MKRIGIALIGICLLLSSTAFSQSRGIFTINAGQMNPKDTKSGMIVGAVMSRAVDDAVDIGLGIDVFHNAYSDESKVAEETATGLKTSQTATLVDYTRTVIPINVVLNVKIPMGRYFGYFIRGSMGYSFLISKEKNYELETSETRKYGGLGWRGGGGMYYQVGRRSTLFGEAFFNSNEVSRDVGDKDIGLPVTEHVDLSGLGFRLGVSLVLR